MPVLLEHIHQPTDADWQDIEKIHQDTADHGLTFNRQQLEQWLAEGGWLMAGRFNDRLIGVILAKRTNQEIELSQAAVRKLTQHRGVIHQLVHHIQAWSTEQQCPLFIHHCPPDFNSALQKRGFVLFEGTWHYQGVTHHRST